MPTRIHITTESIEPSASKWDSTYTTVWSNSADWEATFGSAGSDLAVRALTANWESTYTTFKDASSTFLTSETDSQTLTFSEGSKELSISNGNTVSLSALVDLNAGDIEVRALTANWESTYTTFKDASSTFLTSETDSQVLSFNEGSQALSISNGNTVSLSALVDLNAGDAEVRALTANWESTYTTVQSNSGIWDYQGTDIKDLSANWESTYTTYSSNSSEYIKTDTSNSTPGLSAVTMIIAVSALPAIQEPNTLYILI